MTEYLAERTALLPSVRLRKYNAAIGKSSAAAICIGAHVGYRGIVREILDNIRSDIKGEPTLCATGGHARWALGDAKLPFIFDPDLTLYGLSVIYELNQ